MAALPGREMDKNQLIEEQLAPPVKQLASRSEWALTAVLAVSLATVAVAPFIALGNVSGHDVEFHLPSWIDAAQHWREGVPFPAGLMKKTYGFGDPRFVIYPPLSWIIGGLLALILPGAMLPGRLHLDLHRALGVCGLWVGARMAGPRSRTLGGRTLCHQSLHVAGGHAPLRVFGVTGAGGIPSGAVVSVAGCPLRFAPTAQHCATGAGIWVDLGSLMSQLRLLQAMDSVSALLFVALRRRSLHALVRGGMALGLGLGLATFYILPAALEQHWIQSEGAFATGYDIRANFLFNGSGDADQVAFNSAGFGTGVRRNGAPCGCVDTSAAVGAPGAV